MAPATQEKTELVPMNELDAVTSIDAFNAVAKAYGIDAGDESESVVGYHVLTASEKMRLVNTPFRLVSWDFHEGDFTNEAGEKSEFVSAVILIGEGRPMILNDGGTGIYAQLKQLTAERTAKGHPSPQGIRMVTGGLRVSEYTNEYGAAKTFYLVG